MMKHTIICALSLIISAIIISFGINLAVRLHWWYELNTEITTVTEEVSNTGVQIALSFVNNPFKLLAETYYI